MQALISNRPLVTHRFLFLALLAALALAAGHVTQRLHRTTALELDIETASRTPFQQETPRAVQLVVLYPDGTAEKIIGRRYASAFLDPRTSFRFEIANGKATQFLFSPTQASEVVAITRVSYRHGEQTQPTLIPLGNLIPVEQIEVLDLAADRLLLKAAAGNKSPVLRFVVPATSSSAISSETRVSLWIEAVLVFILTLGAALFFDWQRRASSGAQPFWRNVTLPAAAPFAVVVLLALLMATISKFNAHPDEYLHFESAKYFSTHWFSPALNDPAVEPSFSHYGFSYLQDLDTAYVGAGRFIAAVPEWVVRPETTARIFPVLLLAGLSAWLLGRLGGSLAPLVLLISPQIWYVFSYVNADAWPLTISFLIVAQLAGASSLLNRYLRADTLRRDIGGALCFAILLVLLLTAKRNFYLLFPFVIWVAVWKTFFWNKGMPVLRAVQRWLLIFAIAGALYLPLRLAHEAVNGFHRSRLQEEQAEKFAAPGYKPSDLVAGTLGGGVNLRKRGVTFPEVVIDAGWAERSFQSFCGMYHWMTLRSSGIYYFVMGGLYATLLALMFIRLCRASREAAAFAAGVFALMMLMLGLSAYHSWTGDFQPQGRYLFPILPMIAFLFHQYRDYLSSTAFKLLFMALFAGSVFSFVFTGLRNIPKI